MPTRDVLASFWRAWDRLSPEDQRAFLAAVKKFVHDLRAGKGIRKGLRVKGVQGARGIYELSWAADGRATFQFGRAVVEGEPHLIWRRIAGQTLWSSQWDLIDNRHICEPILRNNNTKGVQNTTIILLDRRLYEVSTRPQRDPKGTVRIRSEFLDKPLIGLAHHQLRRCDSPGDAGVGVGALDSEGEERLPEDPTRSPHRCSMHTQ